MYQYKLTFNNSNFQEEYGENIDDDIDFGCDLEWHDKNDLDLHCIEPDGNEIYHGKKRNDETGGELNHDVTQPKDNEISHETIVWKDFSKMKIGTYRFFVHQYTYRNGNSGFKAKIQFNGETYLYIYNKPLKQGEDVEIAKVTIEKDASFSASNYIPVDMSIIEKLSFHGFNI